MSGRSNKQCNAESATDHSAYTFRGNQPTNAYLYLFQHKYKQAGIGESILHTSALNSGMIKTFNIK